MTIYKSKLPEISLKYKAGDMFKCNIASSADLYDVMYKMFNADTIEYNEETVVIFMNTANNTTGWMKHSTGGTCHAVVDVKMILAASLKCGASAIAFAHNHPSGQQRPSREDEKVTNMLKAGCEAVGIRFLDHIIICGDNRKYYSFCDNGKM